MLDRWVKTRSLALNESEAHTVLSAILSGTLREEALAALRKDPSFHRTLELLQEELALAPQKLDGYGRQMTWLSMLEDDKAIIELEKRVAAMPPFDGSAVAEARRAHKEKSKRELDKTSAAAAVKRAEETASRVEHAGHAPTLGAARLVLAMHLASLVRYDRAQSHVDAAIDAFRKAVQAWPEGGMDDGLPSMLARASLIRTAAEVPAIAALLDADAYEQSTWLLLSHAVSGADGATALAALRRRPEITEAARLAKARMGKRPGLLEVMLARLAGDTEMEQAAASAFQRAELGAALSLNAMLAPGQEIEKLELDFWKSGGKGR